MQRTVAGRRGCNRRARPVAAVAEPLARMTREESLALHNPFTVDGIFRPRVSIDCRATEANGSLLSGYEAICLQHAASEWIEMISTSKRLRALALRAPMVKNLSALTGLRLYNLTVHGGNRIRDWSAIAAMRTLRRVSIHDTTTLTDLGCLAELDRLEVVTLGGGLYRTLKLKSLSPLLRLRRMRVLVLEFVSRIGLDFAVLRSLPRIERLVYPGA